MKKLNYKKLLIYGISIIVCIILLVTLILFFVFRKKTIQTSSNDTLNLNTNINMSLVLPNVTKENTEFQISDTKEKVESANISAKRRLPEYNLYYCIKFDTSNNFEINNEDYILFNDLILLIEENCSILFKYELNGNFSNEPYIVKISNIENKEDKERTEKVSEKELEKEKIDKKEAVKSTSPYFIKVNYTANVVTIYTKDPNGNYTVPYKAMVCSCGKYTPKSGTYKTSNKYVWRPLINNVYGHYSTRIVNKILFHSVPYTSNSNDTLEYWEYDKLGQTASEGCIRLTVADAKWIYNNCPSGTMVEFYSNSNPGPLGKPSAQKISSNVECRNWDPTDPNSNNPWRTYKSEENKNNITINNNSISTSDNNSSNLNNNVLNNSIGNTLTNNNAPSDNPPNNSVNNINANTNTTITNNSTTDITANGTVNNLSDLASTSHSTTTNNTSKNSIVDNTI